LAPAGAQLCTGRGGGAHLLYRGAGAAPPPIRANSSVYCPLGCPETPPCSRHARALQGPCRRRNWAVAQRMGESASVLPPGGMTAGLGQITETHRERPSLPYMASREFPDIGTPPSALSIKTLFPCPSCPPSATRHVAPASGRLWRGQSCPRDSTRCTSPERDAPGKAGGTPALRGRRRDFRSPLRHLPPPATYELLR
jgi:hypothetical protein